MSRQIPGIRTLADAAEPGGYRLVGFRRAFTADSTLTVVVACTLRPAHRLGSPSSLGIHERTVKSLPRTSGSEIPRLFDSMGTYGAHRDHSQRGVQPRECR